MHRTLICKSNALQRSWLQCFICKGEKFMVDLANWTNIQHQKFWLSFSCNNVVFPQFFPRKTLDEKIGDGFSIAPSYPSIPYLIYVNQYDLVFFRSGSTGAPPLCFGFPAFTLPSPFWLECYRTTPGSTRFPSTTWDSSTRWRTTKSPWLVDR